MKSGSCQLAEGCISPSGKREEVEEEEAAGDGVVVGVMRGESGACCVHRRCEAEMGDTSPSAYDASPGATMRESFRVSIHGPSA